MNERWAPHLDALRIATKDRIRHTGRSETTRLLEELIVAIEADEVLAKFLNLGDTEVQ